VSAVSSERVHDLVEECERRRDDARTEAEGARRYAAWMRSPEGKAHRGEWIGLPETTDADAESNEEEAAFWDDILALLGRP
jgi:hypothetical protein